MTRSCEHDTSLPAGPDLRAPRKVRERPDHATTALVHDWSSKARNQLGGERAP